MQLEKGLGQTYEFGAFRLDVRERRLLKSGKAVPLTPKVFDTLLALVENSGRTVEKDELMRRLWPDTFVEESSLAQNVFQLRKALCEAGVGAESIIETVPKRGYRFTAEVHRSGGGAELRLDRRTQATLVIEEEVDFAPSGEAVCGPAGMAAAPRPSAPARRRWLMLATFLTAAALASAGYLRWRQPAWGGAAPANDIRRIAVLPFKPIGPAGEDEQFRVGMADALITRFSSWGGVSVRPTSAILKYTDPRQDAVEAGRELQVDAVLEGAIQRSGNRLRVSAQLVRVRDGAPVWADRFEETSSDIFAVQDSIAEQAALALTRRLSSEERSVLTKRHTVSPQAYQEYVKGRYFWNKRTEEGLRKGIEHFRRAIEIDPAYALAYTGLADSYNLLTFYGGAPPGETFPKAMAAAAMALELDDTVAEAHASLGYAQMMYEWDWRGAERSLRRAVELNPHSATARHWYSEYLIVRGRHGESVAQGQQALEIDPLSAALYTNLGRAYFIAGDNDRAIEQFKKALALEPDFALARMHLGRAYFEKGQSEEAVAELKKAEALSGGRAATVVLGYVYARTGRVKEARRLLDQLTSSAGGSYVPPYTLAMLHADLGEKDDAFRWLERAYEERAELLVYLKVDPRFDSLRPDPRFDRLLQRVGLAE
jgi:DNA-binding winged helix-turn-helix (wHTH) protein/TolB-like protein/Flp pilus assembly protein TadD